MTDDPAAAVPAVVAGPGIIRTRSETAADEAFLWALFESVKGTEMAAMPIGAAMRRQLLSMQFRAMRIGYRSAFPAARFLIVLLNDAPIGRLIVNDDADCTRIVYIALLPEWRRHGLATALMTAALDEPRKHGRRCEATVAIGNFASMRLWFRLGFTERERSLTDVILEWFPR
jgi:GNAT superfamily N-acetyltransferase